MAGGMGKVLFHKTGGWYIAYRVPGKKNPIREYFGATTDGKQKATARMHEVGMLKAKGQGLRNTSTLYLDQLAQHYLNDAKVRGVSKRWRAEFAHLLDIDILPALCHRPVDQLDYPDILAMTSGRGTWANHTTPTINRYLGYLRAVFLFGIAKNLTTKNPLASWRKTAEKKKELHLTVEDLRRIIAAGEPHLAWALEVEWNLGTRPGTTELFTVKWSDVDYQALTVHVRGTKTGESDRLVAITPEFRARLLIAKQQREDEFEALRKKGKSRSGKAIIVPEQTVYLIEYKGRPIKQLRRSLETACNRAGIVYHVRPYDVRHLFASSMLQGGADLAAVSALLGHSDISTTQKHYYHLLKGEKERAVALLPSISTPQKAAKLVKIK